MALCPGRTWGACGPGALRATAAALGVRAVPVTAPIREEVLKEKKEKGMALIKRVLVKKNERALLLRNGDFERVMQPGTHWLFVGMDRLRVETFAMEQTAFAHGLSDYLLAKEPEVVAQHFLRVELSETQVGLRSENGVLVEVLAPATRRLYWTWR
jgi:hypothetical protein